jgi:hypothetical protein
MVLSAEGKLAHEMAFYHKVTECTKFTSLQLYVVSIVRVSGELLKNFVLPVM